MAFLVDRTAMAGALGRRVFGLTSSVSSVPEKLKSPVVRASAGASLPRSSSPKKNRDRDTRPRTPASLADTVNPSISCPLFGDSAQTQLPPGQRLEVPRAASLCEAPSSRELQRWGFFFEDGDAPVHTTPDRFDFDPFRSPSDTSNIQAWLPADVDEPLSWQRSMLETHWLLDAPEREQRTDEDDVDGEGSDGSLAGSSRHVTGTTRRNRIRKKHVFVKEEDVTSGPDASVQVKVKSSLSARARRRVAKGQLSDIAQDTTRSLSKLNLQTVCSGQEKNEEGTVVIGISKDPERVVPQTTSKADGPDENHGNHVWNFMRDIGFTKLLTKEEEVELATTFRAAESLKQTKSTIEKELGKELSQTEWAYHVGLTLQNLRHRLRAGERARERLIAANMRLVVSVVKKYTRQGVLVSDLITAGTMGLAKGVDRFDPGRGFKLSTYVHWWIRQAVTRAAAEHVGAFRLPMHVHETLAKIKRVKSELAADGRAATSANIASVLGVSEKRISKVHKLKVVSKSLDDACPCPVGFSEGASFHNFIHDAEEDIRSWTQIEAMLLKKDLAEIMLGKLNARERDIICMHYGLSHEDGTSMTLDNISLRYGVSRERIRQVEIVAIRKLRALCSSKDLQRYCY